MFWTSNLGKYKTFWCHKADFGSIGQPLSHENRRGCLIRDGVFNRIWSRKAPLTSVNIFQPKLAIRQHLCSKVNNV